MRDKTREDLTPEEQQSATNDLSSTASGSDRPSRQVALQRAANAALQRMTAAFAFEQAGAVAPARSIAQASMGEVRDQLLGPLAAELTTEPPLAHRAAGPAYG